MISVLLFTSFHSASRSIFRIQGLLSPSWSITTNSMATKHLLYLLHTRSPTKSHWTWSVLYLTKRRAQSSSLSQMRSDVYFFKKSRCMKDTWMISLKGNRYCKEWTRFPLSECIPILATFLITTTVPAGWQIECEECELEHCKILLSKSCQALTTSTKVTKVCLSSWLGDPMCLGSLLGCLCLSLSAFLQVYVYVPWMCVCVWCKGRWGDVA
jgi:hypothetical protein